MHYDLCLASNWEYDDGFIQVLDSTCRARRRNLLTVTPTNLVDVLPRLSSGDAGFSALLDRASESDSSYLPLVEIAHSLGARRFNPRELADRAYNKACLHHAFLDNGIPTPKTLILPSYLARPELPTLDLPSLGKHFTAKPALGGGGEGVIMEISTVEEVQAARRQFPEQQYLLQEHVTPKIMDGLPAWFRVIYCLEEIFICHWDTTTHVYTPVNNAGTVLHDSLTIESLREVTRRIARLCRLDLFSTEICLTEENRLRVVDYVNDPIDLRLQSRAVDGVPDFIVERIAAQIVEEISKSQTS